MLPPVTTILEGSLENDREPEREKKKKRNAITQLQAFVNLVWVLGEINI